MIRALFLKLILIHTIAEKLCIYITVDLENTLTWAGVLAFERELRGDVQSPSIRPRLAYQGISAWPRYVWGAELGAIS